MAIPDDSEQTPESPAPTHWNTPRDPEASFSCPRCRNKIELKFVINPGPEDPRIIARCSTCSIAFAPTAWEEEKTHEMFDDCDF